jgi:tetratricopeptide (TPR) repeat protein
MLGNTVMRSRTYGEEYLGFLGWLDTRLPDWFYIAEVVLLLYLCVSDPEAQRRLSARQAWLAVAVALLVGGMVLFIVHLTWDPLGTPYIVIQGRHLIPLGPVVAIALSKSAWLLPRPLVTAHWLKPLLLSIGTATFLSTAIYHIYDRFYVDNDVARAERLYQQGLSLAKARDTREQAYALFGEALATDPGHPGAHYMLGIRSETNDPRDAVAHFRAVLAREPGHASSMQHLGTALAELSEYDEAVRLYEDALRLRPDDARLRNDLARAKRTQGLLSQVEATMRSLARRQAGGGNLPPNRGPVVVEPRQMSLPAPFVWRCPPPSGENIPQAGSADRTLPYPFYACSAIAMGGKRVFVFPPPLGAMLLADEDVSWYWQLPLSDVTPEQRQTEIGYRKARNLQFPLTTLPEADPSK